MFKRVKNICEMQPEEPDYDGWKDVELKKSIKIIRADLTTQDQVGKIVDTPVKRRNSFSRTRIEKVEKGSDDATTATEHAFMSEPVLSQLRRKVSFTRKKSVAEKDDKTAALTVSGLRRKLSFTRNPKEKSGTATSHDGGEKEDTDQNEL